MRRAEPDILSRKGPLIIILLATALVGILGNVYLSDAANASPRTVRVGVYQNEPKVFVDEQGHASGIFIQLLEQIAGQEGWSLVYVPCDWAACLQALQDGQIDLMPDVAYSPERDALYDFHKTPVLESWSRVYSSPKAAINRIPDLNGKRVAVLEGSVQQAIFEQLMNGFGYKVSLVPADSLAQAFAFARDGAADAAIANHLFGDYFSQTYGLLKTTIDFNPSALYFVTAAGRNADLIAAIDRYLGQWLADQRSPYYTTLGHWREKAPPYRLPAYLLWAVGGSVGLLLVATAAAALFRHQVKVRTRHLELASAELRESQRRYQTLATISPVGIFRTDSGGATTYVNPRWCEITGLSFDEALGDGWLNGVHPDDRERVRQSWQAAAKDRQPAYADYRFVRPDGTIAWVMGQAVPETSAEDRVVGYVGTITDITERKQAEDELRRRADEFVALYETAHDLSSQTDLPTLLETITQRAVRLLNTADATIYLYDPERDELELAAANVYAVPRGTRFSLNQGASSEVIRTRRPKIIEDYRAWSSRRPELAHLDYRAVALVPLLHREEIIGTLGVAEIGSDRKYTESDIHLLELLAAQAAVAIQNARLRGQLEEYNRELEARVAQRTEQLRDALLRAQEADRVKSAFLATMSHELRTPLNSIIGFTGVLLQGLAGPLNPEQTKQLGMTRDSARHLLALINDVLDISKIEAGQLRVERVPFDMRGVIESALRSVAPQAQKKGLALTAAIASNVGSVVSDRRRVEQILLNLLSNAIKFTEQGEVRLECRTRDGWLETSVHDTGIGIRPEDLGRLFEPFRQLETGLNRRHEGTGLGLAICKNLVSLLGGEIYVESEWGKGSTFTFTLPCS